MGNRSYVYHKHHFVVAYFPLTIPYRAATVVAGWWPLSSHVTAVIYYVKQFDAPSTCVSLLTLLLPLSVSNGHLLHQ